MDGAGGIAHRGWDQPALPGLGALAVLGCALLAGPTVCAAPQATRGATTYMVKIEGLRFDPATLAVTAGDRIVWINKDPFPHTVTADAKAFDSRDLPADASWTYVTHTTGEYPYGCSYHPTMKATLIVRAKPAEAHRA
jgi:plastocyanin